MCNLEHTEKKTGQTHVEQLVVPLYVYVKNYYYFTSYCFLEKNADI